MSPSASRGFIRAGEPDAVNFDTQDIQLSKGVRLVEHLTGPSQSPFGSAVQSLARSLTSGWLRRASGARSSTANATSVQRAMLSCRVLTFHCFAELESTAIS